MIKNIVTGWILTLMLTHVCFADIPTIPLKPEEQKLIEQGEIIAREIPTPNKNGRTFIVIGLINANVDNIYQVLQDYESYPEFMPNLDKIEVMKRDSHSVVLNYTLDLPLNKVKKYRLATDFKQENGRVLITWKLIPWPGLKEEEKINDAAGYWNLSRYPHKKGYTLAVYQVYTDPGPIPTGLGWIVDILTKSSVPDVVINTRQRVEELYCKK